MAEVSFFYPGHVSPRITSQRGLFTVHPRPQEPYQPPGTRQIVIDAALKDEFRRKLDAVGMHHASIYVDLDGLARRLVALQGYRATAAAATAGTAVPSPAVTSRESRVTKAKTTTQLRFNPRDPQKGQWGGSPKVGPWELSATVTETSPDWFTIVLEVAPVVRGRSLTGNVVFHLHDSFANPVKSKKPNAQGRARLKLSAYGAFTVGALVTQDDTRLELDLAEIESAPEVFRQR